MLNVEEMIREGNRLRFSIQHLAFAIPVFIVLCTMNAAGYRYGASDHALYIPAILRHVDPALFPRDSRIIDTQARLMLNDDVIAAIVRLTGVPLPGLFFACYLLTLALLFFAIVRLGGHFYRTRGAIIAAAAALTLRHAIAKTGTNTLEGYFHPRQVAFALGLLAVAMFLERRDRLAIVLLAAAGVAHTTTVVWFGIWLTVAAWFGRPAARRHIAFIVAVVAAAAGWALWKGPLAGRLVKMDPEWLAVIADKDYLFPLTWPVNVWVTNLIGIPIILLAWRARVRRGLAAEGETPIVLGVLALAVLFVAWLPFDSAGLALAVQMQTSRVFWMIDVLATFYVIWAVAEGASATPARRAAIVAAIVIALSIARGVYTSFVLFPNRKIFAIDLEHADWREAMRWARTSQRDSGWLADPMHAALYGSSLRAAGQRDVLLEDLKDGALAMYDRDIAMSIADRRRALREVRWDTADGAHALASRYDLDFLVTSAPVALPVAYRAGSLTIYRLR